MYAMPMVVLLTLLWTPPAVGQQAPRLTLEKEQKARLDIMKKRVAALDTKINQLYEDTKAPPKSHTDEIKTLSRERDEIVKRQSENMSRQSAVLDKLAPQTAQTPKAEAPPFLALLRELNKQETETRTKIAALVKADNEVFAARKAKTEELRRLKTERDALMWPPAAR